MKVLVINAGSSSVKYAVVDCPDGQAPRTLGGGIVERIGAEGTHLTARRAPSAPPREEPAGGAEQRRHEGRAADENPGAPSAARQERDVPEVRTTDDALQVIAEALTAGSAALLESLDAVEAVGHRVVHGGDVYSDPVRIDDAVKHRVRELSTLAPLHNPANLAGVEAAQRLLPGRPHVAVFDTAFHSTMPAEAHLYGIPLDLARDRRLRRYGFHGTSHKYVARRARALLREAGAPDARLITAHIGNGASLTAVRQGRSIDTTMGFTPLEGVMMGTRSGTVDPALVLHLIRQEGMSPDEVDRLLNKRSGLEGMAAIGSGDLRDVLGAREAGLETAAAAYGVYVYRLVTAVGALTAALDGLDALVFTGGAGENSATLRADVCARLGYLGLRVEPERNADPQGDCDLTASGARCRVLRVRTREDEMIARETVSVLRAGDEASIDDDQGEGGNP